LGVGRGQASAVEEQPDELLDEERVASGALEDRLANRRMDGAPAAERVEELRRPVTRQRLENVHQRTRSSRPARPALREFGPCETQHEHRHVAALLDQVADELEQWF